MAQQPTDTSLAPVSSPAPAQLHPDRARLRPPLHAPSPNAHLPPTPKQTPHQLTDSVGLTDSALRGPGAVGLSWSPRVPREGARCFPEKPTRSDPGPPPWRCGAGFSSEVFRRDRRPSREVEESRGEGPGGGAGGLLASSTPHLAGLLSPPRSLTGSDWARLGPDWARLGQTRVRLGPGWVRLGPDWARLGQTRARLGQTGARLGQTKSQEPTRTKDQHEALLRVSDCSGGQEVRSLVRPGSFFCSAFVSHRV